MHENDAIQKLVSAGSPLTRVANLKRYDPSLVPKQVNPMSRTLVMVQIVSYCCLRGIGRLKRVSCWLRRPHLTHQARILRIQAQMEVVQALTVQLGGARQVHTF